MAESSAAWMGEVLRRVAKDWEAQPSYTKRYIPMPKPISETLPANYHGKRGKRGKKR